VLVENPARRSMQALDVVKENQPDVIRQCAAVLVGKPLECLPQSAFKSDWYGISFHALQCSAVHYACQIGSQNEGRDASVV